MVERSGSKRNGGKIWKCDLLGMQIYSISSQRWELCRVDSMELSTTNDSWLHHISPYVKYLTAGLFVTANDEHTRRIRWCPRHSEQVWYRCVYKDEVIHFSVCPMFDVQYNLHFMSVTVSCLHYRHSAEADRHLQLVSMSEYWCLFLTEQMHCSC